MKILDCTLRDGGYYTSWDFNKKLANNYLKYMEYMPIEYIEIGYKSDEKNEYMGEYFYLPTSTLKNIKQNSTKKISIMINAKDCHNINIEHMLKNIKNIADIIRIATDPNKIEFSLKLAKQIKKLGFKVALNIMYISKIDNSHHFFSNLKNIEKTIDILNLVDSYGSIYPNELEKLILKIKKKITTPLGFHGHDNLQLAFINSLTAIQNGVTYIDSTILGMGRGAGNLKTELILVYLKSSKQSKINLNILGNLIELFLPLQKEYNWGTNLAYMVSGAFSLPQKDVMDALKINRYSLSHIVNQLGNPKSASLPIFKNTKQYKNCLIIGGGQSVKKHLKHILEYIDLNGNTIIIHSTIKYIDLFKSIRNTQYQIVAGNELLDTEKTLYINKYILGPSPRKTNIDISPNSKKIYELEKIDFIKKHHDSPLCISLQTAKNMHIKNPYLVGFDGYIELKNKKELYLMNETQEIINNFLQYGSITSLTESKYSNIKQESIYSKIK